tara:strand:- start:248 stop:475 length:228 start_codon:yes stop_codon:yes gene_type:complete
MSNLLEISEQIERLGKKIDDKLSDRWLTTKEVCQYTGLSVKTVFRAIQLGSLKVSKGTGKNLFRRSWVDKWVEGR